MMPEKENFLRMRVPVLLALLLLLALSGVAHGAPPTQEPEPGPAVDRVFFKAFDVDRAPLDLGQGNMDLYLFGLKIGAATQLRGSQGIRIYEAPATTLSIILNPAPAPQGQLNPFSILEIRQAVQRLINREFVVGDIYRGMALPMVTHLSPTDFDHLTVYDLTRETDLRYDPELARAAIKAAMEKAGAELVDGLWRYQESTIRLKFIIRTEDERREVGDLLRNELKQVGFQVDPVYQQFAPAVFTVYSSDPVSFQWHLYTEGWGRSAPDRYDFATINSMAAPWLGNMPGWRAAGLWQYEHEELDQIGKRLFTGQFASLEERNELYRRATKLALDESVRIWVATIINSFPATDALEGVTEDLVAGPRAPWTLREARIPGQDELTIGHLWVWTQRTTWNPVGGMTDVYSTDIWRNLHDAPIWNHPFTGIPMPFRAEFQVETAGPQGKLAVPLDAVTLDPGTDTWQQVGAGVQATSKVLFDYSKYFQSSWHHGQPITMADVAYSIYQSFDIAYDTEKARIETAIAVTARPYLDTFRGFRVLDENRLEVYVDFWNFEESYIASYASPAGLSMPWELLYAMDTLVFEDRQGAYSDTAAARFDVPWISMVLDNDARLVRNVLRRLSRAEQLPEEILSMAGPSLATAQEAQARYQAALDWFTQYGLLVVSNGPFMLTRYDPPAQFAELQAFRGAGYPFKPGDWHFGSPELVEVAQVEAAPVQIGESRSIPVTLSGPGTLGLRYILYDPAEGKTVVSGEAAPGAPGQFTVELSQELTAQLPPGLYQLFLAGYSSEVTSMTERRVDLEVAVEAAPSSPTAQPTVPPQTAPAQHEEEDGGGGCGRGGFNDASVLLGGAALLGLALMRRRGSR